MKDIKWIFFDIGSTLVHESRTYDDRARRMIKGTLITLKDYQNKREEFEKQGLNGDDEALKFFHLVKTPWPSEFDVMLKEVPQILEYLKSKGYKLGIIANQPLGTEQRLKSYGIRDYFEVIGSSAEYGLSKPDKKFFLKVLEDVNALPQESVMIGDIIQNDIKPAKELGFTTIWFKNGFARMQKDDYGKGLADYIIHSLNDLKHIF
jgi:putative hydrolase of the HAD superfamily